MGDGGANAHVIGDFAGACGILTEVAFACADETSDPTALFGGASDLGASNGAVVAATSVAAVARREGSTVGILGTVVSASRSDLACTATAVADLAFDAIRIAFASDFALAFVLDRNARRGCAASVAVGFSIATAYGIILHGAGLGLLHANARDIRPTAMRTKLAELTRWARRQTTASTGLASAQGTHHAAILAATSVATVGSREGFAIFVFFAVVLAA